MTGFDLLQQLRRPQQQQQQASDEGRQNDPWQCPWASLVEEGAGGTCSLVAAVSQRESQGTQGLVHQGGRGACGVPTWQRAQFQGGWGAWKGPGGLKEVAITLCVRVRNALEYLAICTT